MRAAALWTFAALASAAPLVIFAGDAAAVSNTQYGIVAPIYDGSAASGGSSSFIRLFNGNAAATTFTITVVGSPTGRIYGVASFVVPRNASPQKYFNDILVAANAGALTGGDTGYAFYIQNLDFYAGYQHVTFNGATTFFENASICARVLNQPASSGALLNVHTTKLAGWPSKLQIYNAGTAAVNYQVTAVDSDTGVALGNPATVAVVASESKSMTMAALQTAMGISNPTINQVNLLVSDPSGGAISAVIGHQVTNTTLAADFNLTAACAANPALTAAPVSATTTYEGTIAGSGGQSGTFALTVQAAVSSASLEVPSSSERPQAVSQVSGNLKITGGATVALAGTYDSITKAVSVTGGGFTFSGSVSSGAYAGSYTAPGNVSGVFSSLNATQAAATLYCGTWADQGDRGTFNIHIAANGKLTGVTTGGNGVTLAGQAVGNAFSGSSSEGVRFTGAIQGTGITGGGGGTTFSGSVCTPPA